MSAYNLLLRVYPASFRNEYGEEMRALFARRHREATRPFGAVALWLGTIAEVMGNAALVHWDLLRQDLSYTARMLRRAPGFAITAALIVALGIGATTAAFSVTDFVLLRPLPFPEPDSLVRFMREDAGVPAAGALGGELSRLEAGQHGVRKHRPAPQRFRQPRRHRRAAASRRHRGVLRSLSDAARPAADRPALHRDRRSRWRTGHADPQLPSVADPIRRRPVDRRPPVAPRRRVVHRHRRHAAGVPVPGERGAVLDAAALQRADVRGPQRQLALCGRPAPRRRHVRAGAGRDGRARGPIEAGVPGREQGRRRDPDPPRGRRRVAAGEAAALRAVRRGRLRAADCLRQPGEPAAGARARDGAASWPSAPRWARAASG